LEGAPPSPRPQLIRPGPSTPLALPARSGERITVLLGDPSNPAAPAAPEPGPPRRGDSLRRATGHTRFVRGRTARPAGEVRSGSPRSGECRTEIPRPGGPCVTRSRARARATRRAEASPSEEVRGGGAPFDSAPAALRSGLSGRWGAYAHGATRKARRYAGSLARQSGQVPTSSWWWVSRRKPYRVATSRCRISKASNSNSTTFPHRPQSRWSWWWRPKVVS